MTLSGLGDAAQVFRLRQDGTRLQSDLQRLTSELSTGRHADLGKALDGDFSALSGITRSLQLARSFANGISQAAMTADARQVALERVENELAGFAPKLLGFSAGGSLADLTLANADAPGRFDQAVATLNTRAAGVSLFSGDAPDRLPLKSSDEIMDALRPIAVGAASAEDMVRDIEAWFMDTGGGFETFAWQGGAETSAPVILAEGGQTDTSLSALDPALREALAGLALASLVAEGSAPVTEPDTRYLITAAASRMQSGEAAVIALRADLGVTQGRIEEARVQGETLRAGLEIEHTRLSEADPYRTATELEAVQLRLESLYILTSRLSRLSLSEYLR